VVVRLYQPSERPPQAHSLAQIESARANGCTVGGYLWLYTSDDPRRQVREAVALAERARLRLPVLWLDVEPYLDGSLPSVAQIREAVDECRRLRVSPGIYTGAWVWGRLGDTTEFASLPLWVAQYDGRSSLEEVRLFGGWSAAAGKQYADQPLDRDVFGEEVT
jgi:GH25 family lysozyme M1 (1,4-beta-N-acetylmuramidase)